MLKELKIGKFHDQYTEPCEVLEILPGEKYSVKIKYEEKPKVVHANKLQMTRL